GAVDGLRVDQGLAPGLVDRRGSGRRRDRGGGTRDRAGAEGCRAVRGRRGRGAVGRRARLLRSCLDARARDSATRLMMDDRIRRALESDRTIDITTIGRRSGEARRIEVWFYRYDGRIFLSGSPGRRDWYANLLANHEFTFHLKGSAKADLPARARPITDEVERREVIAVILDDLGRGYGALDEWVAD